jgi:hypothetical protein
MLDLEILVLMETLDWVVLLELKEMTETLEMVGSLDLPEILEIIEMEIQEIMLGIALSLSKMQVLLMEMVVMAAVVV